MSNDREAVPMASMKATQRLSAQNLTRGTTLAEEVDLALSPWRRFRGLLGRSELAARSALLLYPCGAVHTCFMGYPIDVVFLAESGVVVATDSLVPWRFSAIYSDARGTLELPGGTLEGLPCAVGDQVAFLPKL